MEINLIIQSLQRHHDIEDFSCGSEVLDGWLRRTARQHISKGISRTYVGLNPEDDNRVVGFYTLTVAEASSEDLPSSLSKKLPRRIPVVLLGRLAVRLEAQGNGVGALLLVDALRRVVQVSSEVGVCAVLVDAKDERASEFYRHFDFLPLPDSDGRRLVLPVKTAASLVRDLGVDSDEFIWEQGGQK